MTIIFFGSSEFSLFALRTCLEKNKVLSIITTPDQKKGRGLKLIPNAVRRFCLEDHLPVEAPERLKDEILLAKIKNLKPELFVVSSYGKLIPDAWLEIPSRARLNVHPSLLPNWRGAAPIHWPILNGERETGVSIAEITPELDAGDIFHQLRVPLDDKMDADELRNQLAELSSRALRQVLEAVEKGKLTRTPQDPKLATYARKLKKEDGIIDWSRPAYAIVNQVRGLKPWPTAYTHFDDSMLQILKASAEERMTANGKPGELLEVTKSAVRIQTGKGVLKAEIVLPAGKKNMSGADFARGKRLSPGFIFKTLPPLSA